MRNKIVNFLWTDENTTAAQNMTKAFKRENIKHSRNEYFELCADLGQGLKPVDYYHIVNDLYAATYKPRRTVEFFNMAPEELFTDKGDGWTKEDCMLCDLIPDARPWAANLKEATTKAKRLQEIYPDRETEVLRTLSGKYAVVVY